ncbi:AAA family ATPase [Variovorax sp. RB3P1]|uniref:AAA family ATPase n=1 Tax=Variovorax sp. RB3P1 TaxID=3443732 RepID=UPI003F46FFCC
MKKNDKTKDVLEVINSKVLFPPAEEEKAPKPTTVEILERLKNPVKREYPLVDKLLAEMEVRTAKNLERRSNTNDSQRGKKFVSDNTTFHIVEKDNDDFDLSDEKSVDAAIRKTYPDDKGLLYLIVYLELFDESCDAYVGWDDFDEVKRRLNLKGMPQFLQIRCAEYLNGIGYDSDTEEYDTFPSSAHDENMAAIDDFLEHRSAQYSCAVNRIKYHYKSDLNDEHVDYFAYSHPPVFEVDVEEDDEAKTVAWFNRNAFRQGMGKEKENSKFLTKVLSTSEFKEVLTVADEVVFDELERDFPNFRDVINFYKAQFRLCALTGRTRISPILLLGPPGVGKTLFSKKLAQALKTGFTFIDMASASSAWVLSGLHASWHGAKSGKIFDAMLYSPTASPIVVLDEIEKPVDAQRDPKNALYQLLEENSASEFVDEFVDHPVNLSSVIYIACANTLDGISEPLLTRFKIFDIAPPSAEEQALIIKKMYLDEIEGSNLFSHHLDGAIVDSLLTASLREAKSKITDAVGMALLEHTPAEIRVLREMSELSISLELRHFKSHHIKTVAKLGF